MKRLLREPLLHFLIGGSLLFVIYGIVADDLAYAPDRIVIDEERVTSLATTFQRTWLRPPTRNELDALIQGYVDEEVLYREGLALGLDRDDLVIRRRLRQKVEFLHIDLAQLDAATDAELAAFLNDNPERFREPGRRSFRQVFVNPGEDEAEVRRRADEMLQELRAGQSVEGDRTLLPEAMEGASERDVAAVFGDGFATDVLALEGDGWTGPLASSFGLHLVRIDERSPARMPEFAEIRQHVAREYGAAKNEEANRRFVQGLRDRYHIEIRMPDSMSD